MWYESNLVNTIIGFLLGSMSSIIAYILVEKKNNKKETQGLVKDFISCNPKIFDNIFKAALGKDFNELELKLAITNNPSIYFILPEKLRGMFIELFLLYDYQPKFHDEQKEKIIFKLKVIYGEIMSYGYDLFDNEITREN